MCEIFRGVKKYSGGGGGVENYSVALNKFSGWLHEKFSGGVKVFRVFRG